MRHPGGAVSHRQRHGASASCALHVAGEEGTGAPRHAHAPRRQRRPQPFPVGPQLGLGGEYRRIRQPSMATRPRRPRDPPGPPRPEGGSSGSTMCMAPSSSPPLARAPSCPSHCPSGPVPRECRHWRPPRRRAATIPGLQPRRQRRAVAHVHARFTSAPRARRRLVARWAGRPAEPRATRRAAPGAAKRSARHGARPREAPELR